MQQILGTCKCENRKGFREKDAAMGRYAPLCPVNTQMHPLSHPLDMARQSQPIILSSNDTRSLKTLLTRGKASARTLSRARILDLLHRGQSPADIAPLLQVSQQTVYNVKCRFLDGGLQAALYDLAALGTPA